jgi:hypothetical protein
MADISVAFRGSHLLCYRPEVDVQVLDGAANRAHEVGMRARVTTVVVAATTEGKLQDFPYLLEAFERVVASLWGVIRCPALLSLARRSSSRILGFDLFKAILL